MPIWILHLFDGLLTALHLAVIAANLVLWIWPRTRTLHLAVVVVTAASWLGLGFWYGWGYCVLTDWHWNIKRALGEQDLPGSFVQYAVNSLGVQIDPQITDRVVSLAFACAALLSIVLNAWAYWTRRTPTG